jgi:hypothetical protein
MGGGTMVQKEQVREPTAVVKNIPKAAPKRPRFSPRLLIGALLVMTLAFLALAGWTVFHGNQQTQAEDLAQNAASAWGKAGPSALTDAYARNAVVVQADGTKVVGIKAIAADAKSRGRAYTMTQVGDIASTPDGAFTTFAYHYSGDGRGSGVAVLKIARGKIVRQWNFETIATPAPASK